MAVHPDSAITQAEQDNLVGLYNAYTQVNNEAITAKEALEALLEGKLPPQAAKHVAVDIFGDGRVKPRWQCVWPPGLVPIHFAPKPGDSPYKPDGEWSPGTAPSRRHPAAQVSEAEMNQAETLRDEWRIKTDERTQAAMRLNGAITELGFKGDIRQWGMINDVFGDGLPKPVGEIDWPAGIQPMPVQTTAKKG